MAYTFDRRYIHLVKVSFRSYGSNGSYSSYGSFCSYGSNGSNGSFLPTGLALFLVQMVQMVHFAIQK